MRDRRLLLLMAVALPLPLVAGCPETKSVEEKPNQNTETKEPVPGTAAETPNSNSRGVDAKAILDGMKKLPEPNVPGGPLGNIPPPMAAPNPGDLPGQGVPGRNQEKVKPGVGPRLNTDDGVHLRQQPLPWDTCPTAVVAGPSRIDVQSQCTVIPPEHKLETARDGAEGVARHQLLASHQFLCSAVSTASAVELGVRSETKLSGDVLATFSDDSTATCPARTVSVQMVPPYLIYEADPVAMPPYFAGVSVHPAVARACGGQSSHVGAPWCTTIDGGATCMPNDFFNPGSVGIDLDRANLPGQGYHAECDHRDAVGQTRTFAVQRLTVWPRRSPTLPAPDTVVATGSCALAGTCSGHAAGGTGHCSDYAAHLGVGKYAPTDYCSICGPGGDLDGDGVAVCQDGCPLDGYKTEAGTCGCGIPDDDDDGDGVANCVDDCPDDADKLTPGLCGCGVADSDADGDGVVDCPSVCTPQPRVYSVPIDNNRYVNSWPANVPATSPGAPPSLDTTDGDLVNPLLTTVAVTATVADGASVAPLPGGWPGYVAGGFGQPVPQDVTIWHFLGQISYTMPTHEAPRHRNLDQGNPSYQPPESCWDQCPNDAEKVTAGLCGCGVSDRDLDLDTVADCHDACDEDPAKVDPGVCGCGVADVDSDGDGFADCLDLCPADPSKLVPGLCGCGVADTDVDVDGIPDCW